ncbi:MAG TPA: hypothetical protein VGG77_07030 [Roseiarcus sp.]|jgi:DNA-binding cell septation regulator SpoVG
MIRIVNSRDHVKNTLRKIVSIELTRVGIVIHDCMLHEKNGKQWIAFPSREWRGQDGERRFSPIIEFAEGATEARKRFQEMALAALSETADQD